MFPIVLKFVAKKLKRTASLDKDPPDSKPTTKL
jgi:hypothetical protein